MFLQGIDISALIWLLCISYPFFNEFSCCSPCHSSQDLDFGGLFLDCSHRHLTSHDLSRLRYTNVTTIIISNNDIVTLGNGSLLQFNHLKRLECKSCNLKTLEFDALKGLGNLVELCLSSNNLVLEWNAFPFGFFRHTPLITRLFIDDNNIDKVHGSIESNYSNYIDIFESLPLLENLTLDSFSNLVIGQEFTNLSKLKSLRINCGILHFISNNSLKGFQDSNVQDLTLYNGQVFDPNVGIMVFQYLPNVSSLTIDCLHIGNINFLKMMQPLKGREIDSISLQKTNVFHTSNSISKIHDGLLTPDTMRFINEVCISHLKLFRISLFVIDINETPLLLRRCLKSLTIVNRGRILANNIFMFQLSTLEKIESIKVILNDQKAVGSGGFQKEENKVKSFISYSGMKATQLIPNFGHTLKENKKPLDIYQVPPSEPTMSSLEAKDFNGTYHYVRQKDFNGTYHHYARQKDFNGTYHHYVRQKEFKRETTRRKIETMYVRLPPLLKSFYLDGIFQIGFSTNFVLSGNNVKSASFRSGQITSVGQFIGLNALETFDLTGTKFSIPTNFFSTYPKLKNLILSSTGISSDFLMKILAFIPSLEGLDISGNDMKWLPSGIFISNPKLKYLYLNSNRFSNIPFDLGLTPQLETLDLRDNSFVKMSLKHQQAINVHIQQIPRFKIIFSDNELSCACSALPFLAWLQKNRNHFNNVDDFICMSEDGYLTHMGEYKDIEAFWRRCHGRYYFLASFIVASTLLAVYLGFYLGIKHKTLILSKMRQLFLPGFRLKTRHDFTYDVCIGYADQDGEYVRNVLLSYLEDMWKLTTFVHQRDLLQDPLLMSRAQRESFRNVLLITDQFLNRCTLAHNVMKVATFFINPLNPNSVVVMVEKRVRHQIPDYVLQVVDEDNIITLTSLEGFLDYEAKEKLRTRILLTD